MYHIKATWAGFELEKQSVGTLEEAERLVEGTEDTEGVRGKFERGGYEKIEHGVKHLLRVLCVDILCGEIVKSYNFSR